MYETLIDHIKGHIDSKVVENDSVIVRGWSFSEIKLVCPVRCKYDNTIISTSIETRHDIVNVFNKKDILICGWIAKLPICKYVDIQIRIDGEWITFMSFNTFNTSTPHELDIIENSSNSNKKLSFINFGITDSTFSNIYIIDKFYVDPHNIRTHAFNNNFNNVIQSVPLYKKYFETILGTTISSLDKYNMNGIFTNKLEYTSTDFKFLAIICLTPDIPDNSNIILRIKNKTGSNMSNDLCQSDIIGNIYNRLIIINTDRFISITINTGHKNSDLFQLFAFDNE